MQVQKINNQSQNNTNFQGKIFVEPDLSYEPCKFVRRHFDTMQKLIADKPYDLFIKQDHAEKTVSIINELTNVFINEIKKIYNIENISIIT